MKVGNPSNFASPIGVMIDAGGSNKLELYITEILLTEGYNSYDVIDLATTEVNKISLPERPLYIIARSAFRRLDKKIIEKYVNGGGCVIAIRPPTDWAELFGWEPTAGKIMNAAGPSTYTKTVDGYLFRNDQNPLCAAIHSGPIQFVGETDLYHSGQASALNSISAAPEYPSIYPGAVICEYGKGKTAAFAYDLTECIVYLHQGRPENSSLGGNPDPNRDGKFTPDELFKGQLDYQLRLVPQADIHQDYLTSMVHWISAAGPVMPRLWHFPGQSPAVALMTGDSDGMTPEEFASTLEAVRKHGGKFTCYIMDQDQSSVSAEKASQLRVEGNDFGPHLFCSLTPGVGEMRQAIYDAVQSFRRVYGYQPLSHRGHSAIWVGWTEMARALSENGIRMDTNFLAGVGRREAFLNGSALPVKFIDLEGNVIDLYEQSTPIIDDFFSPKLLLQQSSYERAIEISRLILQTCCQTHGALMTDFHPINSGSRAIGHNHLHWIDRFMQSCNDLGVPSLGVEEWVLFNDGRRALRIENYRWNRLEHTLHFEMSAGLPVRNATLLLPLKPYRSSLLKKVHLDGKVWMAMDITLKKGERQTVDLEWEPECADREKICV